MMILTAVSILPVIISSRYLLYNLTNINVAERILAELPYRNQYKCFRVLNKEAIDVYLSAKLILLSVIDECRDFGSWAYAA